MPIDYMKLSDEELEQHFNPRVAARDVDAKIESMGVRSREARAQYAHTGDLRYGPGPREVLDVFHPKQSGAPVQVFVHGGYWRAMEKSGYSFVAAPLVDAGACVVVTDYDLAPAVSLDEIVAQTVRSIAWTYRNIAEYGGDPDRIFISGNSAGAHLIAMALAHDWAGDGLPEDLVKGAAPATGVMDCAPVLRISINDEVRLDAAMAHRNSPIHHPPRHDLPMIVAVGGAEPAGWVELSRAYVRACESRGMKPRYMEMPGFDHFDISAAFGDPQSPLTRGIIEQMGLDPA